MEKVSNESMKIFDLSAEFSSFWWISEIRSFCRFILLLSALVSFSNWVMSSSTIWFK